MTKGELLQTTLSGKTVAFSGNGRKLGYPTANIQTKSTLKDGVYFGYADLAEHKNHPALIFIGEPLTIDDHKRRLEAHLLDIDDKDYYGEKLQVQIIYFHRGNKKFVSVDELIEAMHQDEEIARLWFRKNGN